MMRMVWHRLRAGRRGSVAVESALALLLILVPLFAGIADLGLVFSAQTRLDDALNSAALYSWANSATLTPSNLQQMITQQWGSASPALTIATPVFTCTCVTVGSQGNPQSAPIGCTNHCNSAAATIKSAYVAVKLSTEVPLPLPFPGIASPFPLAVSGTIRLP